MNYMFFYTDFKFTENINITSRLNVPNLLKQRTPLNNQRITAFIFRPQIPLNQDI